MNPPGETAAPRYRFERDALIRFAHCDPAGIVFFPQYFVLFNGLLEDWFTEGLGVEYAELIGRRRIGTPTLSLNCEFSRISRFGDTVTLGLSVRRIGNASFHLALGCRQGAQERVRVQQVLAMTSLETHRAIPIADDLRAAMHAFLDESAALEPRR